MTLQEFAILQEIEVRETAKSLCRLAQINPAYDIEQGANKAIKNNPFLRAVSAREIVLQVIQRQTKTEQDK